MNKKLNKKLSLIKHLKCIKISAKKCSIKGIKSNPQCKKLNNKKIILKTYNDLIL